jgi:hypothetical protein
LIPKEARRLLESSSWAAALLPGKERLLLRMARAHVPRLARDLVALGIDVLALQPRHSLEDYFLSITSKQDVATR